MKYVDSTTAAEHKLAQDCKLFFRKLLSYIHVTASTNVIGHGLRTFSLTLTLPQICLTVRRCSYACTGNNNCGRSSIIADERCPLSATAPDLPLTWTDLPLICPLGHGHRQCLHASNSAGSILLSAELPALGQLVDLWILAGPGASPGDQRPYPISKKLLVPQLLGGLVGGFRCMWVPAWQKGYMSLSPPG